MAFDKKAPQNAAPGMAEEHNLLLVISVFEIVHNFQEILEEHVNRRIALWIFRQCLARPSLIPMDHRKQLAPFCLKRVRKQRHGTAGSTVQKQQDGIFIDCPGMQQILTLYFNRIKIHNCRDYNGIMSYEK
jgi:hypothetical protein